MKFRLIKFRRRHERPIPHLHKGIPCKAKFSWLDAKGKWRGNTYDPDYKDGFCIDARREG